MERPATQVGAVPIGADPGRTRELADFYSRLLVWPIVDVGPRGGWAQLRPPEGETGPTINIEVDREFARPVWPSQPGAQTATMHLDIGVDDLDAGVAWPLRPGPRWPSISRSNTFG